MCLRLPARVGDKKRSRCRVAASLSWLLNWVLETKVGVTANSRACCCTLGISRASHERYERRLLPHLREELRPEAERCPIHGYLFQSRDALRPGIVIDGAYEILQRLGAGGNGRDLPGSPRLPRREPRPQTHRRAGRGPAISAIFPARGPFAGSATQVARSGGDPHAWQTREGI